MPVIKCDASLLAMTLTSSENADAAADRGHLGLMRQLRSELKMLAALPVAQLRDQADDIARQLRDLDVRIQQSNWEAESSSSRTSACSTHPASR
jgi:hypothetical protein